MQYQLLLKDAVTFVRVRRRGLFGAFCIGVAVGMLMFWTPLAVSSTLPTEISAAPVKIVRSHSKSSSSTATLAELERQEALLMQSWTNISDTSSGNQ